MNKTELRKVVAAKCGVDEKMVLKVINTMVACINDAMEKEEDVSIDRLGVFYVKHHKFACGLNKQRYEIKKVAFRASKTFRDELNGKGE